jgi:hypothetical protein
MPVASTIASIAGSLLLPIILNKLAGPAANALDTRAAAKAAKGMSPELLKAFQNAGVARTTSKLSPFVRGAGSAAGIATAALGFALPYILNTLGRTTQAASTAAGAGVQAIGNIPGHLANVGISDAQKAQYGGTSFDALGGISADVGTAAGTGVSALGNAVGGTFNDLGNTLMLRQVANRLLANAGNVVKMAKGNSPSENRVLEQVIRTQGRLQ